MSKITIHLKGGKEPIVLYGSKVEHDQDNGQLIVYDFRNRKIGEFNKKEIAGWSLDKD